MSFLTVFLFVFSVALTVSSPPTILKRRPDLGSKAKPFRGNTFVHTYFGNGPNIQFNLAAPVVSLKPIGCVRNGKLPDGQERFWALSRNSNADIPVNIPATLNFHRKFRLKRNTNPNINVIIPEPFQLSRVEPVQPVTAAPSKVTIQAVLNMIDFQQSVDICFLVDVSEHMESYIFLVRKNTQDLIDYISTDSSIRRWRVSFVGYRDLEDAPDEFTLLNFTRDAAEFRDFFANNVTASGGGLLPNDVFGGIQKALSLDWRSGNRTNILIHMTNAPPHGCEMHTLGSDDFPMGDPESRTVPSLFGQLKEKNIEYVFGNVTTNTDIMIEKFEKATGKPILQFDLMAAGISNNEN